MAVALQNQRNLIFASVFPFAAQSHGSSASTAAADPAFHATRSHDRPTNPKLVQRNVAWNTAIRFLKLPEWHPDHHQPSHPHGASSSARTRSKHHHHRLNADVEEALRYLLVGDGGRPDVEEDIAGGTLYLDLLEWYTHEAREHFVACVRPVVLSAWNLPISTETAWSTLEGTVDTLRQAQAWYFTHVEECLVPVVRDYLGEEGVRKVVGKFGRELHAIAMHALQQQRFAKTLGWVLLDAGCRLFGLGREDSWLGLEVDGEERDDATTVRERVAGLLRGLREVGLGGDQAQRAAAQAMDKLMDEFIGSHHVKVDWYGRKPVTRVLREWVKDGYGPFIMEILSCLTGNEEVFEANEIQQWTSMAIGRLGRARVENLFDYIVHWNRSLGAILDLKVSYLPDISAARIGLTNSGIHHNSSSTKSPHKQLSAAGGSEAVTCWCYNHSHSRHLHLRRPRLH